MTLPNVQPFQSTALDIDRTAYKWAMDSRERIFADFKQHFPNATPDQIQRFLLVGANVLLHGAQAELMPSVITQQRQPQTLAPISPEQQNELLHGPQAGNQRFAEFVPQAGDMAIAKSRGYQQ